jgi:hypothetical protein
MNSFLPSAKRNRELTGAMLAILLSSIPVHGVRAAEEEPGPVDHIVSFFKSLGEKDRDKQRARETAPVRAEPVEEPQAQPQPKTRARNSSNSSSSNNNNSGGQSLDTPPSERPPTSTKKKTARSSTRNASEETPRSSRTSNEESGERASSAVKETQETGAEEAGKHHSKATPDLEAARKELADLKRKMAAVEAQIADATGDGNAGTSAAAQQNPAEVGATAALPPPINPPRNVAPAPPPSTPDYESKKPFANGAQVTLKTPEQTGNSAAIPSTSSAAPQAGSVPSDAVPVGTKTDKPGIVKSPHAPFNEIDVNGLQKGVLAKDPTTHKIFRVP